MTILTTKDEIIDKEEVLKMATQAGMLYMDYIRVDSIKQLEAFAKLVAEKSASVERKECAEQYLRIMRNAVKDAVEIEREACAKVCEEHGKVWFERMLLGFQATLNDAADAIRARGEV